MPHTFITYSRVSTLSQKDTWSHVTQQQSCLDFGLAQGWKLYKKQPHVSDTQTGVDYENRAGIKTVLSLVNAGLVQRVIINDIDRAGRDGAVLEKFVEDIYAAKARPVIALDNREFPTPKEFLQNYHFQIAVAVWQRNKIIIETRRGMKTAFLAGAYLTTPLFGYERSKSKEIINGTTVTITKLRINEFDANLVRQGLELFAETHSYVQAFSLLNKYNLERNPDKRRSFISTSIKRMVNNLDIYLGLPYTVNREINGESLTQTQQHEPIISQDLANRVRLADKLRNRGDESLSDKPYRRLITCSNCGSLAKVSTKRKDKFERVKDFHFSFCNSKARNAQYKRTGLFHLIKDTGCTREISATKFTKYLTSFLLSLDDSLFSSQLESVLAEHITKVRLSKYNLDEKEQELTESLDKVSAIEQEIVGLAGQSASRTIAIFERELESLELQIEKIRESIQIETEEYHKQISTLSNLGISQQDLESTEMLEDSISAEYAQKISNYSENKSVTELMNDSTFQQLISDAGTYSESMDNQVNSELVKSLAQNQAYKVTELIESLRENVKSESWSRVNEIMGSIGLMFTADYSEQNLKVREASIRLKMHGETFHPFSLDLSRGCRPGR